MTRLFIEQIPKSYQIKEFIDFLNENSQFYIDSKFLTVQYVIGFNNGTYVFSDRDSYRKDDPIPIHQGEFYYHCDICKENLSLKYNTTDVSIYINHMIHHYDKTR